MGGFCLSLLLVRPLDRNGIYIVKYDYRGHSVTTVSGSLASTLGKDNTFSFKGYYFDEESSMYYCQSRYYVPEWGRWLNADNPANLDPFCLLKLNLFAYCKNNPINNYDPDGRSALLIAIIALIIGAAIGAGIGAAKGKKEGKKGWELAKSIILGAFIGEAAAGLGLILAGAGIAIAGGTIAGTVMFGKTLAVAGILGFNAFALIAAPLFGIDVQPLDIGPTPGTETPSTGEPGPEYIHPANKKK